MHINGLEILKAKRKTRKTFRLLSQIRGDTETNSERFDYPSKYSGGCFDMTSKINSMFETET